MAEKDENGNYLYLDFIPVTYMLPDNFSVVRSEFQKYGNAVWIAKPVGKAKGKGIFLLKSLSKIKKWDNINPPGGQTPEGYVISRYIENPLLIGGKKFDLRMYVLVTSYKPLKVWLYGKGFARFCTVKYSSDPAELGNKEMHFTNSAIQQTAENYNPINGSKWNIDCLRFFLEMNMSKERTDKCFEDINSIIYHSLKAVQPVMINDKHCFECYGYDVMIDENLKPWLIEVNASPSLAATTEPDRIMKTCLMDDVLRVVVPPEWMDHPKHGANTCTEKEVGFFKVLVDECESEADKSIKATKPLGKR